jgi:hypothetical protein
METCCPLSTVVLEGVIVAGLGRDPELLEAEVSVVVCVVG